MQFFALILIAFVVALFARRVKIPYALALVATGLVVGVTGLLPNAHLDPATLLTVFLPPLLFDFPIRHGMLSFGHPWSLQQNKRKSTRSPIS